LADKVREERLSGKDDIGKENKGWQPMDCRSTGRKDWMNEKMPMALASLKVIFPCVRAVRCC
jgi:hypothetical protein